MRGAPRLAHPEPGYVGDGRARAGAGAIRLIRPGDHVGYQAAIVVGGPDRGARRRGREPGPVPRPRASRERLLAHRAGPPRGPLSGAVTPFVRVVGFFGEHELRPAGG